MPEWTVGTTDEEIDAVLEELQKLPPAPQITEATYHRDLDLFVVKVTDGRRFAIPREHIQPVATVAPEAAANFEVLDPGTGIWWTEVDGGISLNGIIEGRYGNDAWMEKIRSKEKLSLAA